MERLAVLQIANGAVPLCTCLLPPSLFSGGYQHSQCRASSQGLRGSAHPFVHVLQHPIPRGLHPVEPTIVQARSAARVRRLSIAYSVWESRSLIASVQSRRKR